MTGENYPGGSSGLPDPVWIAKVLHHMQVIQDQNGNNTVQQGQPQGPLAPQQHAHESPVPQVQPVVTEASQTPQATAEAPSAQPQTDAFGVLYGQHNTSGQRKTSYPTGLFRDDSMPAPSTAVASQRRLIMVGGSPATVADVFGQQTPPARQGKAEKKIRIPRFSAKTARNVGIVGLCASVAWGLTSMSVAGVNAVRDMWKAPEAPAASGAAPKPAAAKAAVVQEIDLNNVITPKVMSGNNNYALALLVNSEGRITVPYQHTRRIPKKRTFEIKLPNGAKRKATQVTYRTKKEWANITKDAANAPLKTTLNTAWEAKLVLKNPGKKLFTSSFDKIKNVYKVVIDPSLWKVGQGRYDYVQGNTVPNFVESVEVPMLKGPILPDGVHNTSAKENNRVNNLLQGAANTTKARALENPLTIMSFFQSSLGNLINIDRGKSIGETKSNINAEAKKAMKRFIEEAATARGVNVDVTFAKKKSFVVELVKDFKAMNPELYAESLANKISSVKIDRTTLDVRAIDFVPATNDQPGGK